MIDKRNVLLSPASQVDRLLYGYNFFESSLGFGSFREVRLRSDGCIDLELTLEDQGGQKIVQPSVPCIELRRSKAQKMISLAVNEALEEGLVSLR